MFIMRVVLREIFPRGRLLNDWRFQGGGVRVRRFNVVGVGVSSSSGGGISEACKDGGSSNDDDDDDDGGNDCRRLEVWGSGGAWSTSKKEMIIRAIAKTAAMIGHF